MPLSRFRKSKVQSEHISHGSRYKIGSIEGQRYVNKSRSAALSLHASSAFDVRHKGNKGRDVGNRKKIAMIYYWPQNSVSPLCTPTAFTFIYLFPFHGSPSNFPQASLFTFTHPLLFHTISQSDWLPPLLSACQHFYTFVRRSSIHCVPETSSYGHNTSWRVIIPDSKWRWCVEKLLRNNASPNWHIHYKLCLSGFFFGSKNGNLGNKI